MKNLSEGGLKALFFLIIILTTRQLRSQQIDVPPPTEPQNRPYFFDPANLNSFPSQPNSENSSARLAENSEWEKLIKQSEGGLVEDIVNVNGRLFMNHYSALYVSDDHGATWKQLLTGGSLNYNVNYYYGWEKRILVSGNNILFMNKLSKDGGNTWADISIDGSKLPTPSVLELIGTDLYLGTWYYGMYKSSDLGKTFVAINNGYPIDFAYYSLPMAICELNGKPLIACPNGIFLFDSNKWINHTGTGIPKHQGISQIPYYLFKSIDVWDSMWIVSSNLGVYYSSNSGATWNKFNLPDIQTPEALRKNYYPQQNFPPAYYNIDIVGQTIYATYLSDIYTSQDGINWQHSTPDEPLKIYKVAMANNSEVVSATANGVYRLKNGSWQNSSAGFTYKNFHTVKNKGKHAIIASWGGGILHSKDKGVTWNNFSAGLESSFAGRVYFNDDVAYTNTYISYGDGGMYVGSESVMYKRQMNGAMWTKVNSDFPIDQPWDILLDKDDHYMIGLKSSKWVDGIQYSHDRGNTWSRIFSGITHNNYHEDQVTSIYHEHDTLFAGTMMSGIFKSPDHGKTWTPTNSGLLLGETTLQDPNAILGIMQIKKKENRIWFLADKLDQSYGLFYSQDWGKSWNELNFSGFGPAGTICYIHNIHQASTGRMFAHVGYYNPDYSQNTEKLFTCNDDDEWEEFEPAFPERFVASIESIGSYLYATSGYGIHRIPDNDIILSTEENNKDVLKEMGSPYPNPFSDKLSVDVNLTKATLINIEMTDVTGRKIFERGINGQVGTNQINLDYEVNQGLYLLKVKVGRLIKTMRVVREHSDLIGK